MAKGLPRSVIHSNSETQNKFLEPDSMLPRIEELGPSSFELLAKNSMKWRLGQTPLWDQWRDYEINVAIDWLNYIADDDGDLTNDNSDNGNVGGANPMAVTFSRVKEILDNSIAAWTASHGRDPNLAPIHGNSFSWATLDELKNAETFGVRLIDPAMVGNGQGTNTALVKAIRDTDGVGFGRMPARGPFIPTSEINEIIQWIDDGMPADDGSTVSRLASDSLSSAAGSTTTTATVGRFQRVVQILETVSYTHLTLPTKA